jgi:hypothetical protein
MIHLAVPPQRSINSLCDSIPFAVTPLPEGSLHPFDGSRLRARTAANRLSKVSVLNPAVERRPFTTYPGIRPTRSTSLASSELSTAVSSGSTRKSDPRRLRQLKLDSRRGMGSVGSLDTQLTAASDTGRSRLGHRSRHGEDRRSTRRDIRAGSNQGAVLRRCYSLGGHSRGGDR